MDAEKGTKVEHGESFTDFTELTNIQWTQFYPQKTCMFRDQNKSHYEAQALYIHHTLASGIWLIAMGETRVSPSTI